MASHDQNLRLARALSHPVRVRILMAMNTPVRELSPKQFSDESGTVLTLSAYHFRKLKELGFIRLVDEQPRRGATEHYYKPVKRVLAWTEEARTIPPAILDGISATVLRGFVEEAGAAIDSGRFTEREDRVLAWDKLWVDEKGWARLAAVWTRALADTMKIEEECEARREEGADGFFATYGMVAFESPPPAPQPGFK